MSKERNHDTTLQLIIEACLRELQYADRHEAVTYGAMSAGMERFEFEALLYDMPYEVLYQDH